MDLTKLKIAIKACWDIDTCYGPMRKDYNDTNTKSYGQCHVSALIINDHFGGKICKVKFPEGGGHYWNLIDGKEIDLTRNQFSPDQKFPKPTIIDRSQTTNTPEYFLLKKRVEKYLTEHKLSE